MHLYRKQEILARERLPAHLEIVGDIVLLLSFFLLILATPMRNNIESV